MISRELSADYIAALSLLGHAVTVASGTIGIVVGHSMLELVTTNPYLQFAGATVGAATFGLFSRRAQTALAREVNHHIARIDHPEARALARDVDANNHHGVMVRPEPRIIEAPHHRAAPAA